MAEALKSKLNVVAVDCEARKSFCGKNDIRGYPTIKLYVVMPALLSLPKDDEVIFADLLLSFHHGTKSDYTGARTLKQMRKYAMKAIEA